MSDLDLAELRQKAEAATPGPWTVRRDETWKSGDVVVEGMRGHEAVAWGSEYDGASNADYIAAANPTTILRLLDLLTPEALADAMDATGWESNGDPVLNAATILAALTERSAT